DEIKQLAAFMNSSESNTILFSETLESNLSKTSAKANLASGIGLFILGKTSQAVEKLNKTDDRKEKFIYLAYSLRKLRHFDEAIRNLEMSLKHGADSFFVSLEKAKTYLQGSDFDTAEKELNNCSSLKDVSAEYHYQFGRLHESQGLYDNAMDSYKQALELEPNHQESLFHLAYRCDMSGDEEAAIDYYKQIATSSPVYINALINLSVLYEDTGKFDKASQCIDKVLQFHPNHPRAILFQKDIESSKTMYYDEEKEKKKSRKHQILETPISDFELSVRSRNCLKKMKIDTLGDLLQITEAELLSYKNFGETSLREIKAILTSKGLRLGMILDEGEVSSEAISPLDITMDGDEAILNKSVEDLNLSVRSRKCLQKLNLRLLGDLTKKTEAELLGCKNFGVTSLNEVKKGLVNLGLSFRTLD
ncbi:MAG: tetratricopeptide repeat protein, partial [Planctomycetota bacterium]